jgi:hypothetical protein
MYSAGGGTVQYPNFFTATSSTPGAYGIARQAGQAAYAVRPSWNVAGVDYAVGPLASKAQAFKDPSKPGTLPPYCAYTVGEVTCRAGGNSNITFDGFDMSASINHPCVHLGIYGNQFNHITVSNNLWRAADDGATDHCALDGVFFSTANSNTGGVSFINNWIDGKADAASPRGYGGIAIVTNGPILIEYNAIEHVNNRPVSTLRNAVTPLTTPPLVAFANYIDTFITSSATTQHGEFIEDSVDGYPSSNNLTQTDDYSFNTIMQGTGAAPSATTSLIYLSGGDPVGQIAGAMVSRASTADSNTLIANHLPGTGGAGLSVSAIIEASYAQYSLLQITNNFSDDAPGASYYYTLCDGSPYIGGVYTATALGILHPPVWSGNIDMATGNQIGLGSMAYYKCAQGAL